MLISINSNFSIRKNTAIGKKGQLNSCVLSFGSNLDSNLGLIIRKKIKPNFGELTKHRKSELERAIGEICQQLRESTERNVRSAFENSIFSENGTEGLNISDLVRDIRLITHPKTQAKYVLFKIPIDEKRELHLITNKEGKLIDAYHNMSDIDFKDDAKIDSSAIDSYYRVIRSSVKELTEIITSKKLVK